MTDIVADKDGFAVPTLWQANVRKWETLPVSVRKKWSEEFLANGGQSALKSVAPIRSGAPRFTTQYGIKWGRRQGWKLIDRENYNHRTMNHKDLQLGLDALFDDGGDGMVGIQAAGRSERAEHYQRFIDRGGPANAKRRHIRVIYVEFDRGNIEPIKQEAWT